MAMWLEGLLVLDTLLAIQTKFLFHVAISKQASKLQAGDVLPSHCNMRLATNISNPRRIGHPSESGPAQYFQSSSSSVSSLL